MTNVCSVHAVSYHGAFNNPLSADYSLTWKKVHDKLKGKKTKRGNSMSGPRLIFNYLPIMQLKKMRRKCMEILTVINSE